MLRREVLDAQFAGMKQALESPDAEAMQRVKDMLADLNALLAAHARNEDTTDAFADFMAKHGEFFPEQPENVEELIDALARRQAAAQRMLASLSPEQREQLGQLMSQALADADLASEMAQLATTCVPCGRDWTASPRPGCGRAASRSATARPSRRWPRSPTWRRWRRSSPRPTAVAPWTTSTSTCWRSGSGPRAARDFAGAARPGARAGAAGLPDPRRRRAATHPPRRPPARPDGSAPGLRPARCVRARVTTTTGVRAPPTSRPG